MSSGSGWTAIVVSIAVVVAIGVVGGALVVVVDEMGGRRAERVGVSRVGRCESLRAPFENLRYEFCRRAACRALLRTRHTRLTLLVHIHFSCFIHTAIKFIFSRLRNLLLFIILERKKRNHLGLKRLRNHPKSNFLLSEQGGSFMITIRFFIQNHYVLLSIVLITIMSDRHRI